MFPLDGKFVYYYKFSAWQWSNTEMRSKMTFYWPVFVWWQGEAANSDESESAWCEDRDVTQETQAKVSMEDMILHMT